MFFINHSFNSEYFLILKKKKEATFEREDNELEIREQDKVLPWQEILNKFVPITRHEFHRGLNSVRDLDTLKLFYDGVRKKRRDHNVSYSYVKNQCDIKARKIKVKIIQEYSKDDIDIQELKGKINELGTETNNWKKEEKWCGISGKDKKAKSHSKRTEVGVKDVGCKMLESNWNKWNDLAFHRGGHWANF
ncbi:unnamed protein product [Rhizophagus irregularis]|nr:unnamed protein product [Rhizophagus irregularis]